jgi:tRNA splicing ligase
VGGYGDYQKVADSFFDTTDENTYQIFGHRNTEVSPISLNDRVYNLEGQVEFGGCLRCVQVDNNGIHCIETKNKVYKITEKFVPTNVEELINSLRANRYITEKKFNGISSFNFSGQVFSNRIWNEQTTKARGLYIDTKEKTIVARSYNKFFNINERTETKLELLQHRFEFPVTAYVKENGFLGIVGYNKYNDDLLIATKSALNSDHAMWLKDLLCKTVSPEKREELKQYIRENNVSFVFECVDFEHDPHIIEYPENKLFLLDIVYNDMEFKKYEYAEMCNIANQFGIAHKEKAEVFANWNEFINWYNFVTQPEYEYNGNKIEGFVIEDSNGFMTKLKLHYYKFWKQMRSVAHETLKTGRVRKKSLIQNPLANEFYEWLKKVKSEEDLPQNICALRNLFFENKVSE